MDRRTFLALATGAASYGVAAASAFAQELPKLAQKNKYKVGFAQSESNSPWRIAQTESMRSQAQKEGWQLVYTDAGSSAAKQVADMNSMIAQGVDLIFLSPREEKPLIPAVRAAKRAGIPVILLDRSVDAALAKPGVDYITFIGSNFIDEGKRAAEALTKAMNGKATIIQLEGTTGASSSNDRAKGFKDYIKDHPEMQIIASQSGDFSRDKGRQVAETLIQAHPDATALYAHGDEMAIGAITALESAGKKPGKDIVVVSVDGQKDALQLIIDGKLLATVECNPKFGPKAFETAKRYAKGETIEPWVVNPDRFYDASNAKDMIADAY